MDDDLAIKDPGAALQPSDHGVMVISARLGWKPETLCRRVAAALPSITEQRLYVMVARSVRLHPTSLSKILRVLIGPQELRPCDIVDVPSGTNLRTNRFAETVTLVGEALAVSHCLGEMYGSQSVTTAAVLAKAYGPDSVEAVADSMRSYIETEMGEVKTRVLAIAIAWLARDGLARCEADGRPYPHDVAEWLESDSESKRSLHMNIGFPRGK